VEEKKLYRQRKPEGKKEEKGSNIYENLKNRENKISKNMLNE
jgi:hypothetical protein